MADCSLLPEGIWSGDVSVRILHVKSADYQASGFSISIISDDYDFAPSKEGYVATNSLALDFGYSVTTSGKTVADEVLINVYGPTRSIAGRSYCIFSSPYGVIPVPYPASLAFTARSWSVTFNLVVSQKIVVDVLAINRGYTVNGGIPLLHVIYSAGNLHQVTQ